ncbi:GDNF-inducible zinc finger protein 1 isoform X2 [Salarias fasciatus]|uniref:GDNF-inducible zinc finger protein 1-like n=2 Tax=Salarias fasciatus TaxID=181472 RepID=A0A672HN08_SALFA|nr:GDNF-inducible zinc finger protein 1-like isoform X2 [Salarias fasciatus]
MGLKVVQLTSDSHHGNILTSLHELRLQGQLSDVTVQVDHQGDVEEFHAHQVMLAASSGYFKKILLSPDEARDKLLLSNMNSNDFSKFLEFVYTGTVEVEREKISDVQAVATFLGCEDLVKVCSEAMSAGIIPKLQKQTPASEAVSTDGLHDAKKQNKTRERRPAEAARLKRELLPQRSEKEEASKRRKLTGNSEKRPAVRLRLSRRKRQQRHWRAEKEDSDSEAEDGLEAEAQPENNQDREEETEVGTLMSDVDELEHENDNLSDDATDPSFTPIGYEEEEEEERNQEEEEEGEQSEQMMKNSKARFECKKCQRTFLYERSFLKHISTYHGVKAAVVYRCETCSQTFANHSNLKIHEKHVHSNERQFTCSICTKTFKRKKDVVRHQKQVHERNLQHICPICGKSLSSKTALLLHERTHTGVKPYECTECGAKFTQNSALKMHHRIHTGEKPYACDQCEARFTQKHMLSYHKRSHTGEKPFMCEACGKSFSSKEYLRHHSNIHTGSRPYKCEHCGRGFAQRNSLNQHVKVHTGERPYSCKECGRQFTQLNALQRHQRIHTGEKPFMCGLCKRTFTDKSTLRRHTTIHDPDTPWKTYLVVLEGNVEKKKPKSPTKGKTEKEKAAPAEKNSAPRKSPAAAAAAPGQDKADGMNPVPVPTGQVTLPPDWTGHGAIALVSHGGITVIHTEVPSGTHLRPLMTADGTGANVISIDGSAIQVPFSIPVTVSSEAPSTSLSVPALSEPVPDGLLATVGAVSTPSVLEAAASQTILAPVSNAIALPPDIQAVIVDGEACERDESEERQPEGDEPAAEPEED